ncbi:MAG TPA: cytochrome c4, partial [Porticoccaceae bacterium]|nr:cytochrome c4 [Porticoccaceae bacterium]
MKKSFLSIICLMAALTVDQAIASGDAAAGKSKVAVCAGCHGNDGNSMVSSFPTLAGLGENYLVRQLRTIQS